MNKLENTSYSGATGRIWTEQTLSGDTKFVYTQSLTLEEFEKIILKDDPKDSKDLYFATGGIISPNYYCVMPTYKVLS